ncbi:MAG: hypothetical protein RL660_1937 [Bacteroidota bacterium]
MLLRITKLLLCLLLCNSLMAQTKDSLLNANLQPGASMYSMQLLNFENRLVSTDSLPKDKKVLLITLSLTCGHCIEQTKDLMQNLRKFDDTYILICTGDIMRDYYLDYCMQTGFNEKPNLKLAFDKDHVTDAIFAFKGLPQIMVYGSNKRLYKVFYKEQKIETLLAALQEAETATYPETTNTSEKPKRKRFGKKK